ncbi:YqgE/AlgH family protein [Endozoicomonas sp. SESOKO4]|uniref:YqgE/AlgH family protein n=1 Tax=Endozoicomonas sp. SESOKO4 TaxID=2828745 RepID=UPI0021486304|nr:YqgE/AlgH family protein [Endozoicomonas sp. SESOKO4]
MSALFAIGAVCPDTPLMSRETFQSFKNHFLIAMPSMADTSFAGTLTLVCEHSPAGALGIIINRPIGLTLGEIFSQVGIKDTEECFLSPDAIYAGGPVSVERGFVLHSGSDHWESSLEISQGLQLTTSRDILFAMARDEGPDDSLVAPGYAGWGGGQLERELSDNAWLTCKANQQIIFETPFQRRLDAAAKSLGVDLRLLSDQVGHS